MSQSSDSAPGGARKKANARASTAIDIALQTRVDAQLMEQGAFTALEYLIESGRLIYADYESWRRREIDSLDDVLMGSRDKILAEIHHAAAYAKGIGLVEQTQEFHAWPGGEQAASDALLRASADPKVHRLLAARFIPAQNVPQMDLFFDNPVVALTNGLSRALAARNLPDAQQQLDRLYAQAPNHADLAAFDRLLAALGHLNHPIDDAAAELAFLNDVTPVARRILGAQARDMMSPLWKQLAAALRGRTFSPDAPDLHASFALSQAQEWPALSTCVLNERDWAQHPTLCLRLAQASFFRRRRAEALMAWCHLCWRAPEQAAEALDSRRQADSEIAGLWQRFLELEEEAPDVAPGLSATDFPAFILLREPALATQLSVDLPPGSTAGEEHYRCVHRWIDAHQLKRTSDEIAERRALQASHPLLFAYLKRNAVR